MSESSFTDVALVKAFPVLACDSPRSKVVCCGECLPGVLLFAQSIVSEEQKIDPQGGLRSIKNRRINRLLCRASRMIREEYTIGQVLPETVSIYTGYALAAENQELENQFLVSSGWGSWSNDRNKSVMYDDWVLLEIQYLHTKPILNEDPYHFTGHKRYVARIPGKTIYESARIHERRASQEVNPDNF